MKKNKLASQFPKIYRIITENKHYKKFLASKRVFYILSGFIVFVSMIITIGVVIFSVKLYENTSILIGLTNSRRGLASEVSFWNSISQKYEGYKDAYFQIAILEYKLGNFKKAKEANLKAILLDPGFEDSKKLEVLLNGKIN
jgi:tetratricopeptide (TPR) repeat protein